MHFRNSFSRYFQKRVQASVRCLSCFVKCCTNLAGRKFTKIYTILSCIFCNILKIFVKLNFFALFSQQFCARKATSLDISLRKISLKKINCVLSASKSNPEEKLLSQFWWPPPPCWPHCWRADPGTPAAGFPRSCGPAVGSHARKGSLRYAARSA
jgi:hypothetical protein